MTMSMTRKMEYQVVKFNMNWSVAIAYKYMPYKYSFISMMNII